MTILFLILIPTMKMFLLTMHLSWEKGGDIENISNGALISKVGSDDIFTIRICGPWPWIVYLPLRIHVEPDFLLIVNRS